MPDLPGLPELGGAPRLPSSAFLAEPEPLPLPSDALLPAVPAPPSAAGLFAGLDAAPAGPALGLDALGAPPPEASFDAPLPLPSDALLPALPSDALSPAEPERLPSAALMPIFDPGPEPLPLPSDALLPAVDPAPLPLPSDALLPAEPEPPALPLDALQPVEDGAGPVAPAPRMRQPGAPAEDLVADLLGGGAPSGWQAPEPAPAPAPAWPPQAPAAPSPTPRLPPTPRPRLASDLLAEPALPDRGDRPVVEDDEAPTRLAEAPPGPEARPAARGGLVVHRKKK
jgi:hypothetical protein